MHSLLSTRSKFPLAALVFGIGAVLLSSGDAWGVWAKTKASAGGQSHTPVNKSCTANGFLSATCTSDARSFHTDGSHHSRGYAHATSYWSISGWQKSTSTSIYTPYACCSASASAGAGRGFTWAVWPGAVKLIGPGTQAAVPFQLKQVSLMAPQGAGSHSQVSFDIQLDGASMALGSAELMSDGSMFCTGFYTDSFFDVFMEGDTWVATYVGPPVVELDLPVGVWIDIDQTMTADTDVFGASVLDSIDTVQEIEMILPDGYTMQGSAFVEDFEAYNTLEPLPDQSNWEAWTSERDAGDFYVTEDESHNGTTSVVIDDEDDAIHQFSGYTEGAWDFIAWQYVPPQATGSQYFILLNTYPASEDYHWSLQVECNAADGLIKDADGMATLPMAKGQWCEIKVTIDLDQDLQHVYYDGQLLVSKSWSAGVEPGGALEIAAVDLWASGAGAVYYDDISLIESEGTQCPADINGDGIVDGADIGLLLGAWGPCP